MKENQNYDERELRALLSREVESQMNDKQVEKKPPLSSNNKKQKRRKKKKKSKVLLVLLCVLFVLTLAGSFLVLTKPGRKVLYTTAGNYIFHNTKHDEEAKEVMDELDAQERPGKKEEGIRNYLLFGIEEIKGAKNTDSMMIASIDMGKGSIKLVSLMRDSYVEVPGWKSTKLNAAYSRGGVKLLMQTIEKNYKIHLDGYASVNFESFEEIIDQIGPVTIELGKEEAAYLNWANYISDPDNRNVKPGLNEMNGNQLLGYCRVRRVATLGGVNNDYGRTLRHRRAMTAVFDKVKSLNPIQMMVVANDCMGYVTTSLTSNQIQELVEVVAEKRISTIDTLRLPVDGAFDDPKAYEGTTYPLVYDWDKNIDALYQFIYDTKQEPVE